MLLERVVVEGLLRVRDRHLNGKEVRVLEPGTRVEEDDALVSVDVVLRITEPIVCI